VNKLTLYAWVRRTTRSSGPRSKLPDELVDELLDGAGSEEDVVGPGGLQLIKRLVERAMEVGLTAARGE
jgi:hypothetical protein